MSIIERALCSAEYLWRVSRNPSNDPSWPWLRKRLLDARRELRKSDDPDSIVMLQRISRIIGE
jgi:hypothetical protein